MSSGVRVAAVIAAACFAGACTVQLPGGPEPSEPPPRVVTTVLPPETVVITPPPVAAPVPSSSPSWQGTHDCSVLSSQGMTFNQVVDYWYSLGAPTDMDNDADAIPCETIYGEQNAPSSSYPASGTHDCSVLSSQGMTFNQVVNYWYSLGAPTDMDNDADAIPCETIYGEQY